MENVNQLKMRFHSISKLHRNVRTEMNQFDGGEEVALNCANIIFSVSEIKLI